MINTISYGNERYDLGYGYHTGVIPEVYISHSCYKEATGEDGNINIPPEFRNVTGDISTWDFRLSPSSPCIDAGGNTVERKYGIIELNDLSAIIGRIAGNP